MENGRFVTLDYIMFRAYEEYPIFRESITEDKVKEYIYQSLSSFGSAKMLTPKPPYKVTIQNHRAELPEDIVFIKAVATTTGQALIANSSAMPQHYMNEGFPDSMPSYYVTDFYLYCPAPDDTELLIQYVGFATDEDNRPLVPDNERVIRAVLSYIAERIGFQWYMEDRITETKYKLLDRERAFYAKSASIAMEIPSRDTLQSLVNQTKRGFKTTDFHRTLSRYRTFPEVDQPH